MKKLMESLIISLIAVFAPVQSMAITIMVLVLADLVFGVWAALLQHKAITSGELKRTPIKMVVYLAALLLGYLTQHFLMEDCMPLANIISTLVGVTELKSILESLDVVYGQPILEGLVQKLSSKSNSNRN